MVGRITHWNAEKGYGFVTVSKHDGPGKFVEQYFFHRTNFLDETPVLGGIVIFQLGEPVRVGKKIQAVAVRYANREEVLQGQRDKYVAGVSTLAGGLRA